jgi:hypothetical protein
MKAPRDLFARRFCLCMATLWRTTGELKRVWAVYVQQRANDALRGTYAHR